MRTRLLGLAVVLVVLFGGCTSAAPASSTDEPEQSRTHRQSRSGGSFSSSVAAGEPADGNNSTLHFLNAPEMVRDAPTGTTDIEQPLGLTAFIAVDRQLEFRYKTTTGGNLTMANATMWFKVKDTTPNYGFGCDFLVRITVVGPGPYRSPMSLSCVAPLPTPPIAPGTYRVAMESSPYQRPIPINPGDVITFTVQTNGISPKERQTVFMLSGSREHDSMVRLDGWADALRPG